MERGLAIILVLIVIFSIIIGIVLPVYFFVNPDVIQNVADMVDSNFAQNNLVENQEKIVTKIIDGDTVIVEGGEDVRLLGIDCDEKGRTCYTPAKKRIDELLLGKSVSLERDGDDKDMYGRSLRYIFLDGKNINEQMVEEGYCVARFVGDSKYKLDIQNAEENAIMNKVGCKWS